MGAASADNLPAFEDLAGRYTHRLLRFTERLTGDPSAAESITEETLCSLFTRRKNLPPGSRVSVLLYWTASKLSHQWLQLHPLRRQETAPRGREGGRKGAAAEELELDHRSRRLNQAFRVLDDREREVLILTLFEGLPPQDAAAILNLQKEDLRLKTDTAYHKFRQELGEGFFQ
jgi:RNA polymerase sigma-70 factor (ECF subfamily)